MNLSAVDLNLLVVFDALHTTRNVTAAAQRLHRAQPSVSNALSRLRSLFGDELFVRSVGGMQPTELARDLAPLVTQVLEQVRQALTLGVPFDPATAGDRCMTIAASDYADIVLVPHLLALMRRQAPGVDLRVVALERGAIYHKLDDGEVDVAIGGHLQPPKRMLQELLFSDEFVCIADRSNPRLAGKRMTLKRYLELPHALFVPSNDGSRRGVVDSRLDGLGMGLRRRVAATFAHVVALPFAVRGTDLAATMAEKVARQFPMEQLGIWPLPKELGTLRFDVDMVYSPRTRNEAAAIWLRDCLREASEDLRRV
ncbi:MAG: LysR family transcriptional regulator [Burkholderiaceae bacterium]|jgi:DNA-binding transcriptional LysR family regulator|nr:LysR family transcriptional regulator [Burkholderiaceae bacterium]